MGGGWAEEEGGWVGGMAVAAAAAFTIHCRRYPYFNVSVPRFFWGEEIHLRRFRSRSWRQSSQMAIALALLLAHTRRRTSPPTLHTRNTFPSPPELRRGECSLLSLSLLLLDSHLTTYYTLREREREAMSVRRLSGLGSYSCRAGLARINNKYR